MINQIKSTLVALSCALFVPFVSLLISSRQKDHLNELFLSGLANKDASKIENLRLSGVDFFKFCDADTTNLFADICSYAQTQRHYEYAVYVSLLLGILIISISLIVPNVLRNDRKILSVLFGPTVRLVTFGIGFSLIIQGILAAYGIYLVESYSTGRFHPKLVAVLALGGVIAGLLVLRSTFSIFRARPSVLNGMSLVRKDQERLFDKVHSLSEKIGAHPPDNIVVGLEPNFFVTANSVQLLTENLTLNGTTLFLSLPLCRIISEEELDAIIGHELGHFAGNDVFYSMKFAPAYSTLRDAIVGVRSNADRGGMGSIFSIPAVAMLNLTMFQFAKAERTIGRLRELEADRAGSLIAGPRALCTALIKLSIYMPLWHEVINKTKDAIERGRMFENLSVVFGIISRGEHEKLTPSSALTHVLQSTIPHPVDTHPPTKMRIDALGISIDSIEIKDLSIPDTNFSSNILDDLELLEQRITEIEHRWLVATRQAFPPLEE